MNILIYDMNIDMIIFKTINYTQHAFYLHTLHRFRLTGVVIKVAVNIFITMRNSAQVTKPSEFVILGRCDAAHRPIFPENGAFQSKRRLCSFRPQNRTQVDE